MKLCFLLVLLLIINVFQAGIIHLVPLSGGENPETFFNVDARDCMKFEVKKYSLTQ